MKYSLATLALASVALAAQVSSRHVAADGGHATTEPRKGVTE